MTGEVKATFEVPEGGPHQPWAYSLAILSALQRKHIYAGTASWQEKRRRRARNKRARLSRRANR